MGMTMSQKILMIPNGVLFMKNAARKQDFPHILIIPGSGLIRTDLKKPVLQLFLAAALTQGLQVYLQPMR